MRTPNGDGLSPPSSPDVYTNRRSFQDYQRLRTAALRDLPDSIVEDILQDEPRDSARRIQAARERRLRQIIRRYENQIQYGCQNRSCTTPSCLSYRKRNSKTPLRPYTDTSARALACHLVEECSRSRKDPVAGLCQNQPVVPWYQDYRTTRARRKSASLEQHQNDFTSSTNGHIDAPNEPHSRNRTNGDAAPTNVTRHPRPIPTPKNSTASRADVTVKHNRSHAVAVAEDLRPGVRDCLTTTREDGVSGLSQRELEDVVAHHHLDGDVKYLVSWLDHGRLSIAWCTAPAVHPSVLAQYVSTHSSKDALSAAGLAYLEQQMKDKGVQRLPDQYHLPVEDSDDDLNVADGKRKLDVASFAQRLWNTLTLRSLDAGESSSSRIEPAVLDDTPLASRLQTACAGNSERTSTNGCTKLPSSQLKDTIPLNRRHNTAFLGFTLQRLSRFSVLWLEDEHDPLNEEHRGTPFESFIKQSIRYSLGNPNRLLQSARTWQQEDLDVNDCNSVETDLTTDSQAVPSGRVSVEKAGDNAGHQQHAPPAYLDKFNPNATIDVFEIISKLCAGTDILFGTLYDTLQQCYNVSHPRYTGDKALKAARKQTKALGGGLVDHTIENTDQKWLSRKTGHVPDQKQTSQIFALIIMALVTPLFDRKWHESGLEPMLFYSIAEARNENKASINVVHAPDRAEVDKNVLRCCTSVLDHLQGWHRQRLIAALTDCMSHHIAANEISKLKSSFRTRPRNVVNDAIALIADGISTAERSTAAHAKLRRMIGLGILDIVRTMLLTEWDRNAIIDRTGPVGGALELLAAFYHRIETFKTSEEWCAMQFVAQAFGEMDMPVEWLSFEPNGHQTHILAYPFLFDIATLVKYFRAINATAMRKSFESAVMAYGDANHFFHNYHIPIYNSEDVLTAARPFMSRYFVLSIRRDNLLEDALGQIWRRQKREILRPLRVRLGRDEGEDGLDHGGVQQEFFRLAFAEAFDPKYGMFTVDDRTHMVWFQPGSLEPMWKYEALGILLSLAVYNAVTLPITMPLAFYRTILGFKNKSLDHIKDGWPALEKGLRQLLEYDGDVAEDIGRTYEFTYEFVGRIHSININRAQPRKYWASAKGKERERPSLSLPQPVRPPLSSPEASYSTPNTSSPASDAVATDPTTASSLSTPTSSPSLPPLSSPTSNEAPLVTNATRKAYCRDYVEYLTMTSVAPQLTRFREGLLTCISPRALSLFTPTQLRDLIEGHKTVNIDELQASATYEGYEADDEYIEAFWHIVRHESQQDENFAKDLLEFVTASDRVPIGGFRHGGFVIQQNGTAQFSPGTYVAEQDILLGGKTVESSGLTIVRGDRDESGGWKVRLPSSSTCYGRLLLPRYQISGRNVELWTGNSSDADPVELWKLVLRERLTKAVREGRGFGIL